ncbi:hypothetical protein DM02DRAFT_664658 [Periconia macrospinosa]|uniref:Uncharacterized protein n=1 Tax=Periconia macrospinosa TaxID=97972 RepID=A0A2V1CYI6_9PLEO|nr:hypothetical protein DM02DRAFT_664658 [Periconia macrospinosa]
MTSGCKTYHSPHPTASKQKLARNPYPQSTQALRHQQEPKKRQRTPETVPQGNAPGLSQLASLLQELIAQIAQNRQEDNKRWQKMCQMLQYLKGQSESPSSELLQASKERKQELRIVAKAFHDLLVQLEQERS